MLHITLGIHHNRIVPDRTPVELIIHDHPVEFEPEWVFAACNRVEDLASDLRRFRYLYSDQPWLCHLRRAIDSVAAPSMSVEDTIDVVSESGEYLGTWTCDPFDWSFSKLTRRTGTKLIHLD